MSARQFLRLAAAVLAVLGIVGLGWALVKYRALERTVAAKFEGRPWEVPARIYTSPFPLHPGLEVAGTGMLERLRRLGYREVAGEVRGRGEFRHDARAGVLDLHLHAFRYPSHAEEG